MRLQNHCQLVFLLGGLVSHATPQSCYYPEGNLATDWDYQPCVGTNTTFSQCCILSNGERCLKNGLCEIPNRYDYRSACDNKNWDGCPEICPRINNLTWVQVKSCNSGKYCCNPRRENGDCCEDGTVRFELSEPALGSSSTARTTSAASTATSASSSTPAPSSGTVAPAETTTSSANNGGGGGESGSSSGSSNAGAIAGGVVGGVAGLGLIGMALWFWRRKKNAASSTTATDPVEMASSGHGYGELHGGQNAAEMDGARSQPTGSLTSTRTGTDEAGTAKRGEGLLYHEMQG